MTYNITTMDQLSDLAEILCQRVKSLDSRVVIFLHGELGAGKTTLAQLILAQMGYTGIVSSPTYTIINHYEAGANRFAHIDLYRIHSEDELDLMGWDIVLESCDLILIEWPDLLSIKPDIEVMLSEHGGNRYARIS